MADYHIVRGSEIRWRLRFFDADRNPVSPPSSTFHISYKSNGVDQTDVIPMTGELDGLFVAKWDSSVADPGFAYWHARSTGADHAAIDGRIVLIANPANPAPT